MAASQASSTTSAAEAHSVEPGSQHLAFRLGNEDYCIDILSVQEICSYEEPTKMVNAPALIKGVINLRGTIVPIVDLRMKLALDLVTYDHLTVVIVLNVANRVVDLVFDGVSDVVTFAPSELQQ